MRGNSSIGDSAKARRPCSPAGVAAGSGLEHTGAAARSAARGKASGARKGGGATHSAAFEDGDGRTGPCCTGHHGKRGRRAASQGSGGACGTVAHTIIPFGGPGAAREPHPSPAAVGTGRIQSHAWTAVNGRTRRRPASATAMPRRGRGAGRSAVRACRRGGAPPLDGAQQRTRAAGHEAVPPVGLEPTLVTLLGGLPLPLGYEGGTIIPGMADSAGFALLRPGDGRNGPSVRCRWPIRMPPGHGGRGVATRRPHAAAPRRTRVRPRGKRPAPVGDRPSLDAPPPQLTRRSSCPFSTWGLAASSKAWRGSCISGSAA